MIEESNKLVLNVKEKFVKANGELRDVVVSDLRFLCSDCSGLYTNTRNWWKKNREW